jgi:hypothetical protein
VTFAAPRNTFAAAHNAISARARCAHAVLVAKVSPMLETTQEIVEKIERVREYVEALSWRGRHRSGITVWWLAGIETGPFSRFPLSLHPVKRATIAESR